MLIRSAFRFNITYNKRKEAGVERGRGKGAMETDETWSFSQVSLRLQWPGELIHVGWTGQPL